jgi:hypothetical protein
MATVVSSLLIGLLAVVSLPLFHSDVGQGEGQVYPHEPHLTPASSPTEVAQWAVNFFHCREASGHPRVRAVRSLPPLPAAGTPAEAEGPRPGMLVVLAGDFLTNGLAPGFSGWASHVAIEMDLRSGRYRGISAGDGVADLVLPSDVPLDLAPTNHCEQLPNPSRDPRLRQNCDARQFAIVPQVCGWTDPRQFVLLGLADNAFVPAAITLADRTQVTWVNRGQHQHTIAGPGWREPVVMEPRDTWTVGYLAPATHEYVCTIHPDEMRLRLTIRPVPDSLRPTCLELAAQGAACLAPTPGPSAVP